MHSSEFRIYHQTRESLLSHRISLIDAQVEPLKVLKIFVEGLAGGEPTGIWLNPLKAIPSVPRFCPYDLAFLDKEGRVLRGQELSPADMFPRPDRDVASALILPLRTLASSQIQAGDLVALRPLGEIPESPHRHSVEERANSTNLPQVPQAAALEPPMPATLVRSASNSPIPRPEALQGVPPLPRINYSASIAMDPEEALPVSGSSSGLAQSRPAPISKRPVDRPLLLQRAAAQALHATRACLSSASVSMGQALATWDRLRFSFMARDFRPARAPRRSPRIMEEC